MRVAVFSSKPYDVTFLTAANRDRGHELHFLEARLVQETAALAAGFPAVCAFVNDQLDAQVLTRLAAGGTRLVALRSAGFNNVDLPAAARLGITVTRVLAYSSRPLPRPARVRTILRPPSASTKQDWSRRRPRQ
jgi:D-lactate dehydrogenase